MKRLCAPPHSYWWWQHRHNSHPRSGNNPQANKAPLTARASGHAWAEERELQQSSQTFPMWLHRACTTKSCQEKGSGAALAADPPGASSGSWQPGGQTTAWGQTRGWHLGKGTGGASPAALGEPPQRPTSKQKGKWLGKMLFILSVAGKLCVPCICDATRSARQALLQKQMQTEWSVL